jgi:hypothetical protein
MSSTEPDGVNPFAEDLQSCGRAAPEAPVETGFCVPIEVVFVIGRGRASRFRGNLGFGPDGRHQHRIRGLPPHRA